MLTSKTPRLDLHGEVTAMVYALLMEFLKDNEIIGEKELVIIHGKSSDVLKKEVHSILVKDPRVAKCYVNNWNTGETVVILK